MRTIQSDTLIRWCVGMCLGGLCLALGIWRLRAGIQAWTPSGALSHDAAFDICFGALFCWGGVQSFILSVAGERLPNIGHAILLSGFLICLGSPFVYFGIMDPGGIQGSFSVMGSDVPMSQKTSASAGAVVFVLSGSACFVAIPFIWRHYIRKGLMKVAKSL
jgi:hypothetical protein